MARLWSSGFELNSTTASVEFNPVSGTIQSSVVRSGSYAGRVTTPTSGTFKGFGFQFAAADAAGPYFVRFYIRVDTLPNALTRIFGFQNDAGTVQSPTLKMTTGGAIGLFVNNGSTQVGSNSSALSTGQWYRVEVKYDATPASGSRIAELYIDGSLIASSNTLTSTDIINTDGIFLGANLGGETATVCDLFFDDIALNDSTGSAQTGYPGAGSVVHLQPNAAGDNNTWQTSAGGAGSSTNYQAVDEVTPDDATTYLKRIATTIKIDDYNVTSSSSVGIGSGDTITLVQVGIRGGATSATASTARDVLLRLKSASGGTVVKSASSVNRLNVNGWTTNTTVQPKTYKLTSYTDPTTGSAWTPTGTNSLDNMQIGVENQTSSTTEVRVSTTWALVEYVPAGGTTVTPGATSLSISTFAPTISVSDNKSVTPGVASLTISALAASVSIGYVIPLSTASLSIATLAPTVTVSDNKTLVPGVASLAITSQAPSVILNTIVTPGTASLALTTYSSTVVTSDNKVSAPGVASLSITTFAPAVILGGIVTPSALSLSLTAFAPTVSTTDNKIVVLGTASLTIAALSPTVSATNNIAITLGVASVAVTTYAPTVFASSNISVIPGIASLAVTKYAPTVTTTENVEVIPGTASLVLTTFSLTVGSSSNVTVTPGVRRLTLSTNYPLVNGAVRERDYYIDSDANIYWVISETIGLVEKI